jgi:hypothetical protein
MRWIDTFDHRKKRSRHGRGPGEEGTDGLKFATLPRDGKCPGQRGASIRFCRDKTLGVYDSKMMRIAYIASE